MKLIVVTAGDRPLEPHILERAKSMTKDGNVLVWTSSDTTRLGQHIREDHAYKVLFTGVRLTAALTLLALHKTAEHDEQSTCLIVCKQGFWPGSNEGAVWIWNYENGGMILLDPPLPSLADTLVNGKAMQTLVITTNGIRIRRPLEQQIMNVVDGQTSIFWAVPGISILVVRELFHVEPAFIDKPGVKLTLSYIHEEIMPVSRHAKAELAVIVCDRGTWSGGDKQGAWLLHSKVEPPTRL